MASSQDHGSSSKDNLRMFVLKAVIAVVVIVIGVALGVYTGSAFTNSAGPTPETLSNRSYLDIGETFPDHELWDSAEQTSRRVSEIVKDGPVILAFLSHHCPACESMLRQWRKKVMPGLREDIQVILVYDEAESMPDTTGASFARLPGARSCMADRELQRDDDGIMATPTAVAIDTDGRIKFVMTGYNRNVNSDFINDAL